MAETVQTFPDQFAILITMTWGDRQIDVRFTWRERQGSWYIDLFEDDGTPIVFGRRLSANGTPVSGFGFEGDELPRDRQLFIAGPRDPYPQFDLGTDFANELALVLATQAEVDAAKAAEAPPTFTTQVFLT